MQIEARLKIIRILLAVFALVTINVKLFSQNEGTQPPPPQALMPADDNKLLIDKLLTVSKSESFFYNYCKTKILQEAILKKWTQDEVQLRLKRVDYESFKYDFYNGFSTVGKEELNELIILFSKLNKKGKIDTYLIMTPMILNNLELLIKGYLK